MYVKSRLITMVLTFQNRQELSAFNTKNIFLKLAICPNTVRFYPLIMLIHETRAFDIGVIVYPFLSLSKESLVKITIIAISVIYNTCSAINVFKVNGHIEANFQTSNLFARSNLSWQTPFLLYN